MKQITKLLISKTVRNLQICKFGNSISEFWNQKIQVRIVQGNVYNKLTAKCRWRDRGYSDKIWNLGIDNIYHEVIYFVFDKMQINSYETLMLFAVVLFLFTYILLVAFIILKKQNLCDSHFSKGV